MSLCHVAGVADPGDFETGSRTARPGPGEPGDNGRANPGRWSVRFGRGTSPLFQGGWALLLGGILSAAEPTDPLRWTKLAPLPDREGFAYPYAGISNGALLVAGGANFPDQKPWDGGAKLWYDTVFVLEKPDGAWKVAGRLSRPLGYGVSLSTPDGVVCLGGSDAQRHYADAFLLRWVGGRLETKPLPPLPKPVANFCGAQLGSTIYVAGGLERPDATTALHTFWALDLAAAQSTLASSMSSVATAYVTDFHRRIIPGREDGHYLRTARWATVVIGVAGTTLALVMAATDIRSFYTIFLEVLGLLGGTLSGLFLLGIFSTRANGAGALVGAVASAAVVYTVRSVSPLNVYAYAPIGLTSCLLFGWIASRLLPAAARDLAGLTFKTLRRQS